MADIKGTHFPAEATRQDFPEVKDKIIDAVELSSDDEFYGITLRFQDKTTLTFTIEPCVFTFPVLAHWENGEEKRLKLYKPVRSNVPKV